jgi:hypothetical protein
MVRGSQSLATSRKADTALAGVRGCLVEDAHKPAWACPSSHGPLPRLPARPCASRGAAEQRAHPTRGLQEKSPEPFFREKTPDPFFRPLNREKVVHP